MNAEYEEVWVASVEERPGALGEKLAALAEAGADLESVIARRCHDRPGTNVLFVTPLREHREVQAALEEGFSLSCHMHSVRVEGQNEPGIAAKVARRVGDAGLALRGFCGTVVNDHFVLHLAFESAEEARRAVNVLETPEEAPRTVTV